MTTADYGYGAITEEDARFVETWENISPITNFVIRLDMRGDEKPEGIMGPRQFMITTKERKITQDRITDSKYDPFLNGSFRPVIVPDSVNIKTNPNALSDDEIKSILVSSALAWDEWMKTIDSPETLRRMIDLAGDSDMSLKRFRELTSRLEEVSPKRRITQKDQDQYEAMGESSRAGEVVRPGAGPTPTGQGARRPRV